MVAIGHVPHYTSLYCSVIPWGICHGVRRHKIILMLLGLSFITNQYLIFILAFLPEQMLKVVGTPDIDDKTTEVLKCGDTVVDI